MRPALLALALAACAPRAPEPVPWPTAARDLDDLGARLIAGRIAEARWQGVRRWPVEVAR